jgi:hypothetical protein
MWTEMHQSSGQNESPSQRPGQPGDNMNWKLSDADRHAIDLLMNRRQGISDGDGNGGSSEPFSSLSGPSVHQRLHRLENFLKVLELLPASDPPQDLADRTLRRVEQSVNAATLDAAAPAVRPSL